MAEEFRQRLEALHHDIVQQGQRVEALVERAFEAVYDSDRDKASQVVEDDDIIDRADVEIERRAVELLSLGEKEAKYLRLVLTIVKVNNELERIADLAADVAEQVVFVLTDAELLPPVLRVMTNSVIGLIRDANFSLRDLNVELSTRVLESADLIEELKRKVLRDSQEQLASGQVSVDLFGALMTIAFAVERMADHVTNICEQVIYVESGQIVRHSIDGWSKPMSLE